VPYLHCATPVRQNSGAGHEASRRILGTLERSLQRGGGPATRLLGFSALHSREVQGDFHGEDRFALFTDGTDFEGDGAGWAVAEREAEGMPHVRRRAR
jgi:hypothetical protein